MASLNGYYGVEDKPSEGFGTLPAGEYIAAIIASEMKPTKDGTGERLELQWDVLEGPYKNRKLFDNLNLHNKSAQATEIARGQFAAIRKATGVLNPNDSVELHNIPILLKVGVKKDETYGHQNVIKAYKPKSEAKPAAAPTASGPAPWQKKIG